ncbi:MAG TPA: hypothetical protein PJ997_00680 [Candidatus Paceibacterota bacterium]|nr:hypothetical protein [Candidatus Paceibacterota bacterium]HMP18841.1 hypothetical protein [Candidatus Paceibacterota bacterium]HMP85367.1 hypothetical protein [Candidatus Paceibacterota bacterium]
MATNVELTKNKNENNLNLLKRFGRKVQESGVLQYKRNIRYAERPMSDYVKKKKKLKSLTKKKEIEKLVKLGKLNIKSKKGK